MVAGFIAGHGGAGLDGFPGAGAAQALDFSNMTEVDGKFGVVVEGKTIRIPREVADYLDAHPAAKGRMVTAMSLGATFFAEELRIVGERLKEERLTDTRTGLRAREGGVVTGEPPAGAEVRNAGGGAVIEVGGQRVQLPPDTDPDVVDAIRDAVARGERWKGRIVDGVAVLVLGKMLTIELLVSGGSTGGLLTGTVAVIYSGVRYGARPLAALARRALALFNRSTQAAEGEQIFVASAGDGDEEGGPFLQQPGGAAPKDAKVQVAARQPGVRQDGVDHDNDPFLRMPTDTADGLKTELRNLTGTTSPKPVALRGVELLRKAAERIRNGDTRNETKNIILDCTTLFDKTHADSVWKAFERADGNTTIGAQSRLLASDRKIVEDRLQMVVDALGIDMRMGTVKMDATPGDDARKRMAEELIKSGKAEKMLEALYYLANNTMVPADVRALAAETMEAVRSGATLDGLAARWQAVLQNNSGRKQLFESNTQRGAVAAFMTEYLGAAPAPKVGAGKVGNGGAKEKIDKGPKLQLDVSERIKEAIEKKTLAKSRNVGGEGGVKKFEFVPKNGAVLVGAKMYFDEVGRTPVLYGIQFIFLSSEGETTTDVIGTKTTHEFTERAPAGYAVSAVRTRSGRLIDAIQLEFAPIKVPGKSTGSGRVILGKPYGGTGGDAAVRIDLGGNSAIGVEGKCGDCVDSFKLIGVEPPKTKTGR